MTENISWIYTAEQLANTPSRRAGMDHQMEERFRREGVRIIFNVGGQLKLNPNPTVATACVFFHRFYMHNSMDEFPIYVTALGCLFLAGKVEETPKKCKDIAAMAKETIPDIYEKRATLVEDIFATERVLLPSLRFDLHVEHPYMFLLRYIKIFKNMDTDTTKSILQNAWTFANDSLSTTLCLLWEPEVIAISLLYMALKMSKLTLKLDWVDRLPGDQWWDQFVSNLSTDIMEEVCHKILDYYAESSKEKENAAAQAQSATGTQQPTPPQHPTPPTGDGSRPTMQLPGRQMNGPF